MQGINVRSDLFSPSNIKCIEVNNLSPTASQKIIANSVQNAQKILDALERSFHKSSKYEQKLVQCRTTHTHSHTHDIHTWWDSEQVEQNSFKCPNTSPSSSSRNGVGQAGSWSTMSIVCLQYQYEELSKRYEALLQAYDEQCSAVSVRDARLAQSRRRAQLAATRLAHAHRALLAVGDRYLALRRKRNALKSRYEERLNRMKDMLHEVVEATVRAQLRFDTKLAYCMSAERSSDAALLLYEIRKCNLLFLENMRLKSVIEELLPGHVNWKK